MVIQDGLTFKSLESCSNNFRTYTQTFWQHKKPLHFSNCNCMGLILSDPLLTKFSKGFVDLLLKTGVHYNNKSIYQTE